MNEAAMIEHDKYIACQREIAELMAKLTEQLRAHALKESTSRSARAMYASGDMKIVLGHITGAVRFLEWADRP